MSGRRVTERGGIGVRETIVLLVLVLAGSALGQVETETLLKDINQSASPIVQSSNPTLFAANHGRVYFVATMNWAGAELWQTDGTRDGTWLVRDIEPGPKSSFPSKCTVLPNGKMVFAATSDQRGRELYVSDGTHAGTKLLVDIRVGAGSSDPREFVVHEGVAWFSADDGMHGRELWRTDGSQGGTSMVADFAPGPAGSLLTLRGDGGKLIVRQSTLGQTILAVLQNVTGPILSPLLPPVASSQQLVLGESCSLGHVAIFQLDDEVWRSGGTAATTFKLGDLPSSDASWIVSSGPTAYFPSSVGGFGVELFATDGTVAGTRRVIDLNVGGGDGVEVDARPIAARDGLVFPGNAGATVGRELFYTNGTALGTHLIADVWPGGASPGQTSLPQIVGKWDDDVIFSEVVPGEGPSLFRVNPDLTSVQLLDGSDSFAEVFSGEAAAAIHGLVFHRKRGAEGAELWRTAGTAASTLLLKNIQPETINQGSMPDGFARIGNYVYFAADDGVVGRELWRTDGTPQGTELVRDVLSGPNSSEPRELVPVGNALYYTASTPGSGRQVYRYDATLDHNRVVIRLNGGPSTGPDRLTRVGNRLFFTAWVGMGIGRELYVTDGTMAGTHLVADLTPEVLDPLEKTSPDHLTPLGDKLLFFHDGPGGLELWESDGTAAGTKMVLDIYVGSNGSVPPEAEGALPRVIMDGRLYFPARDGPTGVELWSTDGTPLGTKLVVDLYPGHGNSNPEQLARVGDEILFVASTPATGKEIWRTDGTAAGTSLIEITPGSASTEILQLTSLGDFGLFAKLDSAATLYRIHGTTANSIAFMGDVQTINLNEAFLHPLLRLGTEGSAIFRHDMFGSGAEYWITDGTGPGTRLFTDSAAGGNGSDPTPGVRLGARYIYAATDVSHGIELHAFDLAASSAWVGEAIGEGCAGVGGNLTIRSSGEALLGASFGVTVEHAPPFAPVFFFGSHTLSPAPMIPSCDLTFFLTTPDLLDGVAADGSGIATQTATLPMKPALVGSHFYLQAATPLAGGPYLGIATVSAPFEIVIND